VTNLGRSAQEIELPRPQGMEVRGTCGARSRTTLMRCELSSATNFERMSLTDITVSLETATARPILFGFTASPRIDFLLQGLFGLRQRHRKLRHIAKIQLAE
jgi:hypothetical protein